MMLMFSKFSGIYFFENKINGKKYIGQAQNLNGRIKEHVRHLRKGDDFSSAPQRAWNKYGEENFIFGIVEKCSIEELNDKEIYYIKFYGSTTKENGYNILNGGKVDFRGFEHSEETKKRMSMSHIGKKKTYNGKKINWSEEAKESRRGYKHSEETKEKIGLSNILFYKKRKEENPNAEGRNLGIKMKKSTSRYFGVVSRNTKYGQRWESYITLNSEKVFIKSSKNEIDCAKAYDKYIIDNNIDRELNFPS